MIYITVMGGWAATHSGQRRSRLGNDAGVILRSVLKQAFSYTQFTKSLYRSSSWSRNVVSMLTANHQYIIHTQIIMGWNSKRQTKSATTGKASLSLSPQTPLNAAHSDKEK
jgi:hypothetical protein